MASDNHAPVHPAVLRAMEAVNVGPAPAYGADEVTARFGRVMNQLFGAEVEAFPVFNGTGANVMALASALRPFESVLCAETAHIAVDECGAVERATGCKLVPLATLDGKLTPDLLRPALLRRGDFHHSQPRVISVSQTTEYGTLYSVEEVRALADFTHANGMLLHVDGARASNAVAALGSTFEEVFTRTGVDLLSLGGTKNGAVNAEAVIYFPRNGKASASVDRAGSGEAPGTLAPYFRKQATQLSSKQRYLSAQLLALFDGDLWRENAAHANRMASKLAAGIRAMGSKSGAAVGVGGIELTQKPQANALFVRMSKALAEKLQEKFAFYSWSEPKSEYRLMTSFATTDAEIEGFLAELSVR